MRHSFTAKIVAPIIPVTEERIGGGYSEKRKGIRHGVDYRDEEEIMEIMAIIAQSGILD